MQHALGGSHPEQEFRNNTRARRLAGSLILGNCTAAVIVHDLNLKKFACVAEAHLLGQLPEC